MKLVLAVGGTGGHLHPAIALANEYQDPLFIGGGLDTNPFFQNKGFQFVSVSSSPLKGIMAPLKILKGVIQSYKILRKTDLVVGFGSYHSFPVLVAAILKRVPFFLYESNTVPGKVIRLLSRFAVCTGVQFESAKERISGKVECVQTPMKFFREIPKEQACSYYGLDPQKKVVLVFGGSQGAKKMNQAIEHLEVDAQVIHITGKKQEGCSLEKKQNKRSLIQRSYEEKMYMAWSASDVAVIRAGALSLAEMLHYEVPAVLIPYPFASDNHQVKNALYMQNIIRGGEILVEPNKSQGKEKKQKSISEGSAQSSFSKNLNESVEKLLLKQNAYQQNMQHYKKQKREMLLKDLIQIHQKQKEKKDG